MEKVNGRDNSSLSGSSFIRTDRVLPMPSTTPVLNTFVGNTVQAMLKNKLFSKVLRNAECDTSFHWSHFLKSILIHLVYFLLLGPFSLIIFIPLFGYRCIVNMQFTKGMSGVSQNLIWLLNASTILVNIFYPYQDNLDLLILMVFATIVRSLVISLRYGYTSPAVMDLYNTVDIFKSGQGFKELIIRGWLSVEPLEAMEELKSTMWRHNISGEEFLVSFKDKVSKILYERMSEEGYYRAHDYNFEMDEKIIKSCGSAKMFSNDYDISDNLKRIRVKDELVKGERLAQEMIMMSKVYGKMPILPILIAAIHCFLPFVIGAIQGDPWGEHWSVTVVRVTHMLLSFLLNALNMLIVLMSYVDYKRRLVLLDFTGDLLSIRKKCGSYFPRIDLLNPSGVLNWLKLRLLLMNCGKKYQVRANMYNSLFLISYCLFFTYIMLYYFDALAWDLSVQFLAISWFDLGLFLTVLFYVFHLGIEINEQFGIHADLLQDQKQHMNYIKMAIEYNETEFEPFFPYRHNKEIGKLVHENEAVKKRMENIMESIDIVKDKLDIEEKIRPLRILGIVPTFEIMQTALVFILGLIFTIINRKYNLA
eukprot:TRINITY_DN64463_c0_g1_i1.p1 TRINITY_DN64463_c0_g1~~TRINITY_DN64463_c0_g1_i1.p1  ORF type:complete len:590 (+),score=42.30 TRINITY_DN64463_c0_g1_i1:159-1928(+)